MIDTYSGKKFNESRFLRSDFRKKLLLFAKEWDRLIGNNLFESVQKWLKDGDYNVVRYFLQKSAFDEQLHLSLSEFSYMSVTELVQYRSYAIKKRQLLEKRDNLYQEYLTFYDLDN